MSNSQFVATIHDVTLLDLKSFRKDEIWFMEKNNKKEPVLYSLEKFKRKTGFRDSTLIVIATEGQESEPQYFNELRLRYGNPKTHI